jgi:hypothetical protein
VTTCGRSGAGRALTGGATSAGSTITLFAGSSSVAAAFAGAWLA